jgi:hypothetical protein
MASTSQPLRFSAGAAAAAAAAATAGSGAGGGSFDALTRILADLCTRGNPKVTPDVFLSPVFVWMPRKFVSKKRNDYQL